MFPRLQEQLLEGKAPECQLGHVVDGGCSSKSGYFVCSHRRWPDLPSSRRCSQDHFHQTFDQCTFRSHSYLQLACCTMTTEGKSNTQHLLAPATGTAYPASQEEPHRRLNLEEEQVCKRATDEEQETSNFIVSRLHVERGHADPRGMIVCLRKKASSSSHRSRSHEIALQCVRGCVRSLLETFTNQVASSGSL